MPRSAKTTKRIGNQTVQARRDRVVRKTRRAPSSPPHTPNPRIVQPVTTHRAVGSDVAAGDAARRTPPVKKVKRLMLLLLKSMRFHGRAWGVCSFQHDTRLLLLIALVRVSRGNFELALVDPLLVRR